MSHKNRVLTVLEHVRGPTVLDLGAVQHDFEKSLGDWWLHGMLADQPGVETLVGVDLNAYAAERLNRRGYDIRVADVETMALDVRAETVVMGELIEHLANPGLALERIAAHLSRDGRLVITTPNPWAIVHLRRILLHGETDVNSEHTAWFGPAVLRQLLERHGFIVTEIEAVGPDNYGLTSLAKRLGFDRFGGNTWVVVAELVGGEGKGGF